MGEVDFNEVDLEFLYWNRDMSQSEIAEELGVGQSTVSRRFDEYNIDTRDQPEAVSNGQDTGRDHYRWTERVQYVQTQKGYEEWRVEKEGDRKTVQVHRLLAVAEFGFGEVEDKHVHHKNRIPWDNRTGNIQLVTPEEHTSLHNPVQYR